MSDPSSSLSLSSRGYPLHPREAERLASLREVAPHVRGRDALMEAIACLASKACGAEFGLVSLLEELEEIVVGCAGVEISSVERSASFCSHAILQPDPLVVEDALRDPRFRDLPCVAGEPHVRLYVGAPIFDAGGLPLGGVCALGTTSREISSSCVFAVRRLAERAGKALEERRLLASARERGDEDGVAAARARLDDLLRGLSDARSPREAAPSPCSS